jgi:transcriptional regulator with XRE-family HTH domain
MPKQPQALAELPTAVSARLRELGEHLAIARKRRKQSLKAWAARIGVTEPTVVRMERGDAGVGMGIYATALWLMGRANALAELAAPAHDLGALEEEVRAAQARSARSARLAGPAKSANSSISTISATLARSRNQAAATDDQGIR